MLASLFTCALTLQAAPEPLVVHAVVLLADNVHQGILPVRPPLGNGQSPGDNLYWGALYGFDTHFARTGWKRIQTAKPANPSVLAHSAFHKALNGRTVIVVGEAWDGRHSRAFLERYFLLLSGDAERETVMAPTGEVEVGAAAQLVVYIGHNVLMDIEPPPLAHLERRTINTAILACQSDSYFSAP
ncbi:MAG: hypothetical protein AAF658_10650, partial [Myxococcota bacterium]